MRRTTFAAIAAGALILAGIAGWATASNRVHYRLRLLRELKPRSIPSA